MSDLENNTPSSAWRSVVRDTKITSNQALAQEEREALEGELIVPRQALQVLC
jgi:alkylated DNA nucleotide flippase Atl1